MQNIKKSSKPLTRMLYPEKVDGEFQPYLEFYPLKKNTAPLGGVLIFPGGGYTMRADHEGAPVAERFNQLGFHAFVLQYRVAPCAFPAPLQDGFAAIRMLRQMSSELHLNPQQLAVCGFSAGAHLAGCMGTMYREFASAAERPDALILCYPVISLGAEFGHNGSGKCLLGEAFTQENIQKYSLENRVSASTPPSFLWHTADDNVVPVRNTFEFARCLNENKVTGEVHVFPHGCHGLGLAPEAPNIGLWPELAMLFLTVSCDFDNLQ